MSAEASVIISFKMGTRWCAGQKKNQKKTVIIG
jgi:hypothetical protein